jgi:hypothetical protein
MQCDIVDDTSGLGMITVTVYNGPSFTHSDKPDNERIGSKHVSLWKNKIYRFVTKYLY